MKNQFLNICKHKNHRIFFLFLFVCGSASAQSDIANDIGSQLNQYRAHALQEKLFVHTDKSFYVAGEIVWFKVYNVDASYNKPLDLSKIAYLEIISKDQKPVLQAKIAMKEGSGKGSFFIPLSIQSGNYKLRAYTNWMKNFSPDFYFEKNITIVNAQRNLAENPAPSAPAFDIHFFPEGGNLVAGIQSKVAFSVTDQFGKGVDYTGTLIDQDNNTVASFKPLLFGMGHFSFTPAANKKYKAVIRMGNNNAVLGDFPVVYDQGYVMQVEDANKDQVRVTVSTNMKTPNQFVYLIVHNRQIIKAAEMSAVNDNKAVFTIEKNKLGDGISSMTVFNNLRQPICERLYFKRPSGLKVLANTNLDEYQTRKKVIVNIDVQDNDKPSVADMSMSVYRTDTLTSAEQNDIVSYLWLSSDLQGNIESPSYYLTNSDAQADEATDNLMLTHGWRRFRWEDVLQNKMPVFEFLPEYEGHIITGKITDKKSGAPAENVLTYVSVPGTKYQVGTSVSNNKGQLQFDIKNFYGSNEIILETDYTKDSSHRLDVLSPFAEKFSAVPVSPFSISENVQDELLSHSIGTQVQNAYLTENLQKFDAPDMIDSTAFYGTPDKKFFLDEYTRFNTMEEVMREYIAGVSLRKRSQKFYFRVLNDPYRLFFEDDPLVLLDGVPVFDADKIIAMDPLKVKKIEVVNRQYFLGPLVASGIVSYTTYKGDLEGFQFDPNTVVLEYEGLQLQREFYSPVYETPQQINSRMPDFRNVLFWTPDIKTDKRGQKQLQFYTSDQAGKYLVVIQGINSDGKAGSYSFSFDVHK
ncbi:MAG TPA: hypothetical protein VMI12_00655 [Puia sp.]|nr:hypothetical protein [Puia sp.]